MCYALPGSCWFRIRITHGVDHKELNISVTDTQALNLIISTDICAALRMFEPTECFYSSWWELEWKDKGIVVTWYNWLLQSALAIRSLAASVIADKLSATSTLLAVGSLARRTNSSRLISVPQQPICRHRFQTTVSAYISWVWRIEGEAIRLRPIRSVNETWPRTAKNVWIDWRAFGNL